jgi:ABC-2 type transport system ATP-binding protein
MAILEIKDLVKGFNGLTALNEVTFSIEKGDFFGLLGPNGAGKSTLMNCIIGYLKSDNGNIFLNSKNIDELDLNYRSNVGYVPQEIALYLEFSAQQNLKLFGGFYNLSKSELNKRISDVLKLVQLEDRKNDLVKNFSGGMKRRLNLAVSILHDPELILCDEPTVGVDPQSRNAIFDMLYELNKNGKTILYTTHYMEEAERLCNRLAIIDYGKIIAQGTLNDLISLLDKKETIKIRKSPESLNVLDSLASIGLITETDFYFEIIPNNSFSTNSMVFEKLEKMEIPSHLLELSRASLEDVFLNLTGRRLRD